MMMTSSEMRTMHRDKLVRDMTMHNISGMLNIEERARRRKCRRWKMVKVMNVNMAWVVVVTSSTFPMSFWNSGRWMVMMVVVVVGGVQMC